MTKTALIRMTENQPQIIYIGNKETAESKLFRIILNSETPFVKKVNDYGIEVEVTETRAEIQGKKSVPVTKAVRYFMQTLAENDSY